MTRMTLAHYVGVDSGYGSESRKILHLTAAFFALLPKLIIEMFKGTIGEPFLERRFADIARHFVSFFFIGVKTYHSETSHEWRRISWIKR